jgi:BASS family bile acid:Na+ symporter
MLTNIFTNILLPLSLAIIMLGMGSTLSAKDFGRIITVPKPVLLGLLGQLLFLPLLGFAIATLLLSDPYQQVGVMILASCAGGATSNAIVYLSKGDLPLSITLTACSSLVTVFTIPLVTAYALSTFLTEADIIEFSIGNTNLILILLTAIPVMIGMTIKHYSPRAAVTVDKIISKFSIVFFVVLFFIILYQNLAIIKTAILEIGFAAWFLNLLAMAAGYGLAKLNGLEITQRKTLSIEVGVQNGATAIFIASTILANPEISLFPAIYSIFMYVNVFLLFFLVKSKQS